MDCILKKCTESVSGQLGLFTEGLEVAQKGNESLWRLPFGDKVLGFRDEVLKTLRYEAPEGAHKFQEPCCCFFTISDCNRSRTEATLGSSHFQEPCSWCVHHNLQLVLQTAEPKPTSWSCCCSSCYVRQPGIIPPLPLLLPSQGKGLWMCRRKQEKSSGCS